MTDRLLSNLPDDLKERLRLCHQALSDAAPQALEQGHAYLWCPLVQDCSIAIQRNLTTQRYHLVVQGLDVHQCTVEELERFLDSSFTVEEFFGLERFVNPLSHEERKT